MNTLHLIQSYKHVNEPVRQKRNYQKRASLPEQHYVTPPNSSDSTKRLYTPEHHHEVSYNESPLANQGRGIHLTSPEVVLHGSIPEARLCYQNSDVAQLYHPNEYLELPKKKHQIFAWELKHTEFLCISARFYDIQHRDSDTTLWRGFSIILTHIFREDLRLLQMTELSYHKAHTQFESLRRMQSHPIWIRVFNCKFDVNQFPHQKIIIESTAVLLGVPLVKLQTEDPKRRKKISTKKALLPHNIAERKRQTKRLDNPRMALARADPQLENKDIIIERPMVELLSTEAVICTSNPRDRGMEQPKEKKEGFPCLFFRAYDETSAGVNGPNGFLAARQMSRELINLDVSALVNTHLSREKVAGPFISTSNSLIWVLHKAVHASDRSMNIAALDTAHINPIDTLYVNDVFKSEGLLRKNYPRYRGTREWLVINAISGKAIIHHTHIDKIKEAATLNAAVAHLLRLDLIAKCNGVPSIRKALTTSEAERIITPDMAAAIAIVSSLFGINVLSNPVLIQYMVFVIVQCFMLQPAEASHEDIKDAFLNALSERSKSMYPSQRYRAFIGVAFITGVEEGHEGSARRAHTINSRL